MSAGTGGWGSGTGYGAHGEELRGRGIVLESREAGGASGPA
ncbi:hypothetical protein [Rubrivirga sp.]